MEIRYQLVNSLIIKKICINKDEVEKKLGKQYIDMITSNYIIIYTCYGCGTCETCKTEKKRDTLRKKHDKAFGKLAKYKNKYFVEFNDSSNKKQQKEITQKQFLAYNKIGIFIKE